jgi:hypothetical protein
VLEELKRLQKKQATEKKSLGRLVSELLTEALARREREVRESVGFEWVSKQMKALVDLEDKDALYAELDHDR